MYVDAGQVNDYKFRMSRMFVLRMSLTNVIVLGMSLINVFVVNINDGSNEIDKIYQKISVS